MNELLQIARYHRPMPGSTWFWLHKNRDLCRCLPRPVRRQGWLIYVRAGRGRSHKGRQVIYVRRLMDLLVCAETCEKMIFHDPDRTPRSGIDGRRLALFVEHAAGIHLTPGDPLAVLACRDTDKNGSVGVVWSLGGWVCFPQRRPSKSQNNRYQ